MFQSEKIGPRLYCTRNPRTVICCGSQKKVQLSLFCKSTFVIRIAWDWTAPVTCPTCERNPRCPLSSLWTPQSPNCAVAKRMTRAKLVQQILGIRPKIDQQNKTPLRVSVQQSHLPYPKRLKAKREICDSGTQAHRYKWHYSICRTSTTSRAAQSVGIV